MADHTFEGMMPKKIQTFFQAVNTAITLEELNSAIREHFTDIGVKMYNYHQVSFRRTLDLKPDKNMSHFGFPSFWTEYCKNNKSGTHESIINPVFDTNRPFTWAELIGLRNKTAETEEYISHVNKLNIGIGLVVPVYGAQSLRGIFTIGFEKQRSRLTHKDMSSIHWFCQITHHKFIDFFVKKNVLTVNLSKREHEVLKWIAQGKSNSEIAIILDISKHTVSGYVARVFLKLNVNDRVSASLRAIDLGLI